MAACPMRQATASIALVLFTSTISPAHAEQSAEDRAFASALEARLRTMEFERQNCGRSLGEAVEDQFDTIDRVQRASRATPQGGTTIGEKAQIRARQRNLDSAVDSNYDCIKSLDAERASINATLADPTRLHSESERLRKELRPELLTLLADVRIASLVLNSGTSYDEFALKMGAVGNRLRTIRTKYAIPLSRGDHKALGEPISAACTALYAALGDWKQVQQAGKEVASAQTAAARAATWEADFFQRQLRTAQLKQADAQRRLTERKGIALALVQGAARVAQEDSKTERSATVRK
jgi:hypothetical protein